MSFLEPKVNSESPTFWDHLDALRWAIFRILGVTVSLLVILFGFKDFLFDQILLPPLSPDFVFYRFLCQLANWLHAPDFCPGDFHIQLINIDMAGQFMAHLSATFSMAFVLAVPYILYELWRFVSPALYATERRQVGLIFFSSSFLFYLGSTISYLLVFPLTIRFLGTYEVSKLVPNQISLQSYLGTLYVLVFAMGLMFEMPVLAYFLSKLGLINRKMLARIRSYALVVILVLAAVVTPTTDPFTMLVVALPLYLLYEVSILVAKK